MQELVKIDSAVSPEIMAQLRRQLIAAGEDAREKAAFAISLAHTTTDEGIRTLKEIRAELNRDFKAFEDDRKALKKIFMDPYDEILKVYKENITDVFQPAEKTLKAAIDGAAERKRQARMEALQIFFDEYAQQKPPAVAKLADFKASGAYDELRGKLTGSTDEQLHGEIMAKIDGIERDLVTINLMTNSPEETAELIAEYSTTRSLSDALLNVKKRREQIKDVRRDIEPDAAEPDEEEPEAPVQRHDVTIRFYGITEGEYNRLRNYVNMRGLDWEEVI